MPEKHKDICSCPLIKSECGFRRGPLRPIIRVLAGNQVMRDQHPSITDGLPRSEFDGAFMIDVLSGVKLQDFTDTLEESHLVIIPSEFFDLL